MKDGSAKKDQFEATVSMGSDNVDDLRVGGHFTVECYDSLGDIKWQDGFDNLVVNQGLADMNAKYFSGTSYSATWFMGLIDNSPAPTLAAADSMSSHAGWTESANYSGARKQLTFGTPTQADPSVIAASAVSFSITGADTIYGAFVASDSVVGGTSGILFSEGAFSSVRNVVNGDTLNVTYSLSNNAA
jgi:hypothetical protein